MEIIERKPIEARAYQLQIVEHVCEKNSIIYLPTGSGKTYIAILALKRFAHQLVRPIEEGGKRAVFLCCTVELARQQALAVRTQTNLRVGLYIGERSVDTWNAARWKEEICDHQVLVGTAQTILNLIQGNYLKISNINLVIMDECHNGTKNHPYHEFMKAFQYTKPAEQPRVVGLTGVLIKGNKISDLMSELKALEATFLSSIITVRGNKDYENVMIYSTKPKEQIILFDTCQSCSVVILTLIKSTVATISTHVDQWDLGHILPKYTRGMTQQREPSKKNSIKNMLKDFLYQLEDLGLYAAAYAILNCIVTLEIKKRQSETLTLRNLYRYMISQCEFIHHTIKRHMEKEVADVHSAKGIYKFSTPKLRTLLIVLTKFFSNRQYEDISCLVFVERRSTSKCVYNVISRWIKVESKLQNVIIPSFMVGRQASVVPTVESILESKWNGRAIDNFRNGLCNLIVCSSVLEEGIDIQACNYVFVLDRLKTFNSYIQTKGRARNKESHYVIFTPNIDSMKTKETLSQYTKVHEDIRAFLCSRTLSKGPEESEIAAQFYDIIPPYRIPSGAYMTALSALTLIDRYCQMLPNDSFGHIMPKYEVSHCPPNKWLVKVRMPPQSSLKEVITSDPMSLPRIAKASAAMKAAKRLYEIGELNERLTPVTKRECIEKVSEQFFTCWKKHKTDVNDKKAGLNQKRVYKKLYPEEFCNALPKDGEKCYAYVITMKPDFVSNDYSQPLHELLLDNKRNYAILLRKKLPKLAVIQMFMSQGKVRVTIESNPIECMVLKNQLTCLIGFHTMIFRDILNLWQNRNFLVIDQRNQENSFLIVPVANQQIDWDLVMNFQGLTDVAKPSIQERKATSYRPCDYVGRVVGKWYTPNPNQRFIVTRVRTDLSASSPFPNDQFTSYRHFFEDRYGCTIVQPQQFLIEVRELTKRRNFFVNAKNKDNVNKYNTTITLIPELCHNFLYPSDMWLKAILLPCVLLRAHYMLHGEYIRVTINKFLNFDKHPNFVNYSPEPLIIDPSLKRAIDIDGNATLENEEKKVLLKAMPSKNVNSYAKTTPLGIDALWQEYLEPIDCKTRADEVYPVEVDYYYNFISELSSNFNQLVLEDELLWKGTQLEIQKPKESTKDQNRQTELALPAITDVPMHDKYKLEILELTFGRTSFKSAEQHEFLSALTTSAANDMFDMERFEILGDAFLKFSIALYLTYKFPTWNEGFLTAVKSKIVSNRNLLYCMMEKDFAERIYGTLFRPEVEWMPPLVSLPANILDLMKSDSTLLNRAHPTALFNLELNEDEKRSGICSAENMISFKNSCTSNEDIIFSRPDDGIQDFIYQQSFMDKTVADMLEAILGVCVKNYGIRHSFRLLEFFNILQDKNLESLLDRTLDSRTKRSNLTAKEVDCYLINYEFLEKNLSYKFNDRSYLLQALTHPSYPTNRVTGCYQEMEFMGDAILDFLISCYIFEKYQHFTPGKLTDLRTALVNNITLACVCVRHRFHLFMLAENSPLADAVKSFAEFQEQQNHRVTHQMQILSEEYSYDANSDVDTDTDREEIFNMAKNVDVPKALGDIVEAIIAAVYLDSKDLDTTWRVIHHLLEQELIEFGNDVPIDPVRELMENTIAQPKFSDPITNENTVLVKCEFRALDETITVNGFADNKENAKKAAAKHALQLLAKRCT